MINQLPYLQIYVGDFYINKISSMRHEVQCLWFRLLLQMHVSEQHCNENVTPQRNVYVNEDVNEDVNVYVWDIS